MVTWMFRGRRRWFVPVALLNAGLVASTVLTGAHYFIDVVGTCAVFTASLALFRIYGSRLVPDAAAAGN
jgi:membrane-associated phospholipid phosphatase